MKSSRLILFAARWAIMSGLAGTIFAVLVFTDERPRLAGDNGMLLAAAALLAIAFILAPFVRNAFVGARPDNPVKSKHKTLLDEIRQEGEANVQARETVDQDSNPRSVLMSRLLIALYVVFGAVLTAVLWSMS